MSEYTVFLHLSAVLVTSLNGSFITLNKWWKLSPASYLRSSFTNTHSYENKPQKRKKRKRDWAGEAEHTECAGFSNRRTWFLSVIWRYWLAWKFLDPLKSCMHFSIILNQVPSLLRTCYCSRFFHVESTIKKLLV